MNTKNQYPSCIANTPITQKLTLLTVLGVKLFSICLIKTPICKTVTNAVPNPTAHPTKIYPHLIPVGRRTSTL